MESDFEEFGGGHVGSFVERRAAANRQVRHSDVFVWTGGSDLSGKVAVVLRGKTVCDLL